MPNTKRESVENVCDDTGKPFLRPKSWRLKISNARKKFYKNNPEQIPAGDKNPMFGTHRKGKDNPNFGKRWSEEKRKHFAKQQRKNSPWIGKKHTISTRLKMIESAKRVKKTEQWREKMRISALRRAKEQGHISFNPKACKYFNQLNKKMGWTLQHAKNGGEVSVIGYSLDAYDKKRNLVVEYDESHHYDIFGKLKPKDVKRMERIMEHLKCDFYRFNEPTNQLIRIQP